MNKKISIKKQSDLFKKASDQHKARIKKVPVQTVLEYLLNKVEGLDILVNRLYFEVVRKKEIKKELELLEFPKTNGLYDHEAGKRRIAELKEELKQYTKPY